MRKVKTALAICLAVPIFLTGLAVTAWAAWFDHAEVRSGEFSTAQVQPPSDAACVRSGSSAIWVDIYWTHQDPRYQYSVQLERRRNGELIGEPRIIVPAADETEIHTTYRVLDLPGLGKFNVRIKSQLKNAPHWESSEVVVPIEHVLIILVPDVICN